LYITRSFSDLSTAAAPLQRTGGDGDTQSNLSLPFRETHHLLLFLKARLRCELPIGYPVNSTLGGPSLSSTARFNAQK
jgi:hypothetical protein